MRTFFRMTKLTPSSGGVAGRASYISDVGKQALDGIEILAQSSPIGWQPYRDFEKLQPKSNANGRELLIALPTHWAKLSPDELLAKSLALADSALGKSTDYQLAVHFGAKGTKFRTPKLDEDGKRTVTHRAHDNLHLHVVFSERSKTYELPERRRYDRDIWHTADGRVAKRRADRHRLVHKKGDFHPSHGVFADRHGREYTFTGKNPEYKKPVRENGMKERLTEEFIRQGETIDPPNVFKYYHQGNGSESAEIAKKNDVIKEANNKINAMPVKDERRMDFAENMKRRIFQRFSAARLMEFMFGYFAPQEAPERPVTASGPPPLPKTPSEPIKSPVSDLKPSQPPKPERTASVVLAERRELVQQRTTLRKEFERLKETSKQRSKIFAMLTKEAEAALKLLPEKKEQLDRVVAKLDGLNSELEKFKKTAEKAPLFEKESLRDTLAAAKAEADRQNAERMSGQPTAQRKKIGRDR